VRLDSLADDIRYALRGLRRRPVLSAAAILTLALGIGANATMFGVVDRLLVREPEHVRDPERVVRFYTVARSSFGAKAFTTSLGDYAGFAAMRDHGRAFERVAAYMSREMTLGRGVGARPVNATLVSANFFPLLGVAPALGRFFADDEDRNGAAPVAVLSASFWGTRFGSDSTILGQPIVVHGTPYTVVGVTPRGFTGVELGVSDVWLPLHVAAPSTFGSGESDLQRIGGYWLQFFARLREGATREAASEEATALLRQSRMEGISTGTDLRIMLGPIIKERGPEASDDVRTAKWVAGMSLVVLLIACANVGNMLLARAIERRREIAVRVALGVTRGRLVALVMTEAILLALLGGLGAVMLSLWTTDLLRATLLPDVTWTTPPLDPRIVAVTLAITLATGLVAGIVPALRVSHTDLMTSLKIGERSEGSAGHTVVRRCLLVLQGALCVVLLVGAGLFVRSVDNLRRVNIGLDPDRAIVADVDLESAGYEPANVAAFFDRAAEAVSRLPSVERASIAAAYPFGSASGSSIEIPGRDSLPRLPSGGPYEYVVSPGFFATLGTRLLRGRDFTASDRAGAPNVIIINETMARTYWPGADPLGACVRLSDGKSCTEVIGIVENLRRFDATREEPSLLFYTPLAQSEGRWAGRGRALVVRARGAAATTARDVRSAIQGVAPNLPFVDVGTFREVIEPQLRPWRLGAALFSTFGGLALLVGAIGLYGVINFGVLQRRAELAIRAAVGARPAAIVRSVIGEGALYMAIAVALGLTTSIALGRLLGSLLFEVSPHDIAVYSGVTVVTMTVAVLASSIPAWRAARVDPAEVLRAE
jgi:predicted permease